MCIRDRSISQLTSEIIRDYATEKSWLRGKEYYDMSFVGQVYQRGNLITAEVLGSQAKPYMVVIDFQPDQFISADCNCPYDWGGYCKHIVAALLSCLHELHQIQSRQSLEQILDRLNDIQTQDLIQQLVATKPELINDIEHFADRIAPPVEVKTQPNSDSSERKVTINPNAIRSQVRYILEKSVRHFEYGGEEDIASEEIGYLIQDAQMYAQQGDYGNAITMLTAITEACIENWDVVDEYGVENDEVATELSDVWCETILLVDLEPSEKKDLQGNLEFWHNCWGEYFDPVSKALAQGWDYPPLVEVLQGNINSSGAWDKATINSNDDLTLIRLQVLERQERFEEYLYLAKAEGQVTLHLNMLTCLGRVSEAMQTAQSSMTNQEEALAFSKCLVNEQNAQIEAMAIAKTGLELPGRCEYELATWTSKIALELNDLDTVLDAKINAFQANPNFADYLQVAELAKENWSNIKEELLASLATCKSWNVEEAKVNIYLHEGMVDNAISIVDNFSFYGDNLVHKVMDAAITNNPDWVIENACKRSDSILNAGKSQSYDEAIAWLGKARNAFLAADRKKAWSEYRANLITIHGRKRKFMGLIKSLI